VGAPEPSRQHQRVATTISSRLGGPARPNDPSRRRRAQPSTSRLDRWGSSACRSLDGQTLRPPTLARRYGAQDEAYRRAVPGWVAPPAARPQDAPALTWRPASATTAPCRVPRRQDASPLPSGRQATRTATEDDRIPYRTCPANTDALRQEPPFWTPAKVGFTLLGLRLNWEICAGWLRDPVLRRAARGRLAASRPWRRRWSRRAYWSGRASRCL
jgi:hypothetical protein